MLHPDNEHILFPLGTTIVVRHIISRTQQFLRGHDNDISVITVSSSGKYIASGQRTHSGFQVCLSPRFLLRTILLFCPVPRPQPGTRSPETATPK